MTAEKKDQRTLNEKLQDYIESEENPFPKPVRLILGTSHEDNMQVLQYLRDEGLRIVTVPVTPFHVPAVDIPNLYPLNNYSEFFGLKEIQRMVARLKDPSQKLDYEILLEQGKIPTCWMCG